MAAIMTGQQVLQLSDAECDMMASALVEVAQHYDFTASSKTMATVNLAAVMGMIYLPRIIMMRPKRAKPPAVAAAPAMPEAVQEAPVHGRYDFSGDVPTQH